MGKQDSATWGCTAVRSRRMYFHTLKCSEFSLVLRAMERRAALLIRSRFMLDASRPVCSFSMQRPPLPAQLAPSARCRCSVSFQLGSRGMKEGMLPCQPEGGGSWQQAQSCSIQGDGLAA